MAVTIDVLKVGYSELDVGSKTMKANCTCSLIQDNDKKIVVDTLTAWDGNILIKALEDKNLHPGEITHVVCTHGHSDHVGNLNLFTSALHIVGQSISQKDNYILHSFEENNPYRISENVDVIATPGHTLSDVSVIVKKTPLGTVAVVGDLFEREDDIQNPDLWKETAGSEDPRLQYKNREKVLQLADYIVPGHGPGFAVTEELRRCHQNQRAKFEAV